MTTEPEDTPGCHCCGFQNPVGGLKEYPRKGEFWQDVKYLCPLCANTHAGMAIDYPEQYSHEITAVLKAACWIGNQLRRDLAEGRVR